MHAGTDSSPCRPLLPAATTVATLFFHSVDTAPARIESSQPAEVTSEARLRLAATSGRPSVLPTASWLTWSRAASTSEVRARGQLAAPPQEAPVAGENTWMATIDTSGATPREVPLAPTTPATWVPCSQPSPQLQGRAAPAPIMVDWPLGQALFEKQASATTRPARAGWVPSTPESMTATARPAPVNPAAQAVVAPTWTVERSRAGASSRSASMRSTNREVASWARSSLVAPIVTTPRVSSTSAGRPAVGSTASSSWAASVWMRAGVAAARSRTTTSTLPLASAASRSSPETATAAAAPRLRRCRPRRR
ncbi:MAG: hypothetical protein R2755_31390 [Acidimicrobiales bacterium]